PLQLDAVESFARGTISRREFVRRGLLVGLSMGSISAVIAACGATPAASTAPSTGGGQSTGTGASAGTGPSASAGGSAVAVKTGGTIKVACQRPVTLDTI